MTILSHKLFLASPEGERLIEILIHRPQAGEGGWTCGYEIAWPEGRQRRNAAGIDALQSLVLALQMIGADIYSSSYHQEGRLRAYEREKGYGFPLPSTLRDLAIGVDAI